MFVKCGEPLEALMRWKALSTNNSFTASTVTYICILAACADIGLSVISYGTYIHSLLSKNEMEQEDVMAALLNMYARCGQPLKSLELWHSFTRQGLQHRQLCTLQSSLHVPHYAQLKHWRWVQQRGV